MATESLVLNPHETTLVRKPIKDIALKFRNGLASTTPEFLQEIQAVITLEDFPLEDAQRLWKNPEMATYRSGLASCYLSNVATAANNIWQAGPGYFVEDSQGRWGLLLHSPEEIEQMNLETLCYAISDTMEGAYTRLLTAELCRPDDASVPIISGDSEIDRFYHRNYATIIEFGKLVSGHDEDKNIRLDLASGLDPRVSFITKGLRGTRYFVFATPYIIQHAAQAQGITLTAEQLTTAYEFALLDSLKAMIHVIDTASTTVSLYEDQTTRRINPDMYKGKGDPDRFGLVFKHETVQALRQAFTRTGDSDADQLIMGCSAIGGRVPIGKDKTTGYMAEILKIARKLFHRYVLPKYIQNLERVSI